MQSEFGDRHTQIRRFLQRRFDQVQTLLAADATFSEERALLLGAYFSHEYSLEAAGLREYLRDMFGTICTSGMMRNSSWNRSSPGNSSNSAIAVRLSKPRRVGWCSATGWGRCGNILSAFLLDLADPTRVLGRLREPLITPNENEREGYVPNVVYSCGSLLHGQQLTIPYAMSDYAATFATLRLEEVLAAIE